MSNFRVINLKNLLLVFATVIVFIGNNAFASDNVLQAIQVDGIKDSYNIILKSDDVAELKKTVQAPNKMVLNLKGIRASKTINTIYNNTSNVDSVVVEPIGEDSVKILIQADNAENAQVHFDTLKTPLGVLDKIQKPTAKADELILNAPIESYQPVYGKDSNEENTGFSISAAMASPLARNLKNIMKNGKISWMITFGFLTIMILSGLKTMRSKDGDIKVGLTQSLKQRELDLYREGVHMSDNSRMMSEVPIASITPQIQKNMAAGANYGLRAYQSGSRSPYVTSEIQQRPRPAINQPATPQPIARAASAKPQAQTMQAAAQNVRQGVGQGVAQKAALKTAPTVTKPKTSNIDSIKFLESMTKIYEKNGRSDLAQGLKTNMKKAKMNLA